MPESLIIPHPFRCILHRSSREHDEVWLHLEIVAASTVFLRVPFESGLTAGPVNPQCVSDNWRKRKSSSAVKALPVKWSSPHMPEAKTAEPIPPSFRKSLLSIFISLSSPGRVKRPALTFGQCSNWAPLPFPPRLELF